MNPGLKIGGAFGAVALLLAALVAARAASPVRDADAGRPRALAALTRGFGQRSFLRITATMDPAMLAVARRHDPLTRDDDLWGRPQGWGALNLAQAPTLGPGISTTDADQARRLNAALPVTDPLPPAARPFVLTATGPERERAVLCLTQAIYFEAALEPQAGQEAVAQTVLNRMRHPDFPHTVCGVVYQGSQHITGCQFSFTCDGSRNRGVMQSIWQRTRQVAEHALAGYVQPAVGTATFYHADYVFPSWGPTLVKIGQIGQHIFYRFPGQRGAVQALSGRWSGGELRVSMDGPPASDVLALEAERNVRLGGDAGTTILSITDPTTGALRNRVAGQVLFGRRAPTREEIAEINRRLALVEAQTPRPRSDNPELEISAAPWADPPWSSRTPAENPPSAGDSATPVTAPAP